MSRKKVLFVALLLSPIAVVLGLVGLAQAVWCMTFHRDLKMVHVKGLNHGMTCQTCGESIGSMRNWFLTAFYFQPWWMIVLLPFIPIALAHKKITGHKGRIEHPPEHCRRTVAA